MVKGCSKDQHGKGLQYYKEDMIIWATKFVCLEQTPSPFSDGGLEEGVV